MGRRVWHTPPEGVPLSAAGWTGLGRDLRKMPLFVYKPSRYLRYRMSDIIRVDCMPTIHFITRSTAVFTATPVKSAPIHYPCTTHTGKRHRPAPRLHLPAAQQCQQYPRGHDLLHLHLVRSRRNRRYLHGHTTAGGPAPIPLTPALIWCGAGSRDE